MLSFSMKDGKTTPQSIAPCGMNCSLCLGFQREKNKCHGCRNEGNIKYKTKRSDNCVIKNCPVIKENKSGFCYECDKFPCTRLKKLDKRYREKYHMSMLENLENIKSNGIKNFVKKENTKWKCPDCNGLICVHRGYCLKCDKE